MIKDKFIHLISINNDENFSNKNLLSWLKFNSDWKCKKWNSNMINNFLKTNYQKIFNYYTKVDENKKKHIASYLILYHFGGIYINSDLICLKPIKYLLKFFRKYNVILSKYPNINFLEKVYYQILGIYDTNNIISNEIMISKKNNSFWMMLINEIIDKPTNFPIEYHTGYIMLSNIYYKNQNILKDVIRANNNFLIPCNKFSQNCTPDLSYSKISNAKKHINVTYLYYNYLRNIKKLLILVVFTIIIYNITIL